MTGNNSTAIADLLRLAAALEQHSETPHLDCQLLISHVLGKPRSYLFAHPEEIVPAELSSRIRRDIERRRLREPIAYLIGYQEFWSMRFEVNRDVLIPRPETELLVELALRIPRAEITTAVDLGTGSGAIAIAIKSERPEWQVTATDSSQRALRVSERNMRTHSVEIERVRGNWFTPLEGRRFDLIVSNPPYVERGDPRLDAATRFEPECALASIDEGMADLRVIVQEAPFHLNPGGHLIVEHGYNQRERVCDILREQGFEGIGVHRDLAGHDRAISAVLPGV